MKFKKISSPSEGHKIEVKKKAMIVPDDPIIPVIEGDGVGRDIMRTTRQVVDATLQKTYGGAKRIVWFDVYAGERAQAQYKEWLPKDTVEAIKYYIVALKGPLTTPIGGGFRSLNVTLRQVLNLYACVRPVRYFAGVPTPVLHPEKMDVVIFRENTEDVYAGIEWPRGSKEAKKLITFLSKQMKVKVRADSGVGIKPISVTGTKRLVRKAIKYALENNRKSVTLVHKGNIMKYTEGAFAKWGFEVATREFRNQVVTEEEVNTQYHSVKPEGKLLINDRLADSIFQQILTRPDEYDILATPNLNGDYLSDACAAQVGGLGMAPGANIGDFVGLFEATHGTAPKYADKDMVNPGSLILSASMMLEYLGFKEAALNIQKALQTTINQKTVTYDLARLMDGATRVSTSEFGRRLIANLQ